MLRTIRRAILPGFAVAALLATPSFAQTAGAQDSFNNLAAQGFRVVSTVYVPAEAQPDKNPAILVTLTKDKGVAVCTFGLGSWENVGTSKTLDTATVCDVRRY